MLMTAKRIAIGVLRFISELVRRHPLPPPIVNLMLMVRWRCYIHPFASIGYPYNVEIGRYAFIGKCKIVAADSLKHDGSKTIRVGSRARVGDGVVLSGQGGSIVLGEATSIHDYSIIYGLGGVMVGDDTRIAAGTIMVSHRHDFQSRENKIREGVCQGEGITIGYDCWIGAGSRILDGVHIGNCAIVGAGAVVTRDVEAETVVVGVPAKFLKNRHEEVTKRTF